MQEDDSEKEKSLDPITPPNSPMIPRGSPTLSTNILNSRTQNPIEKTKPGFECLFISSGQEAWYTDDVIIWAIKKFTDLHIIEGKYNSRKSTTGHTSP